MATNTTSANALVPEQVANLLVQPLEDASVVLAAGPRIIDSSSPVRIPRITSRASAAFVAEGGEITPTDPAFDELDLLPSTRTSVKAISVFTNESLRSATMGLDAILRESLVTSVANALDTALLTGAGTTNSITGLVNQEDASTGSFDPADPDSFIDALAAAAKDNVVPNRWMFAVEDWAVIAKQKDNEGVFRVQPDVTQGGRFTLQGVPVTVTNKLTQGTAVLADMTKVVCVRDTDPSVTLLPERYAEFDSQAVRVTCRYDLGLLQGEGVTVLTAESDGS